MYAKAYIDAVAMATDICIRVGLRIRSLRTQKGWTQEMLAGHAGTGRVYITEMENGRKEVCVRMLERLASALEVSLSDFFNEV
jgi:transcriptional regulator with XRE-family HTH domain